MAGAKGRRGADADPANTDTVARQAAEVAVELSEARGEEERKRAARGLRGIAVRVSSAATSAAATARRGAGSAGRGLTAGLNWLTAQVLAMGPRLRIRDQATLRAQFPGRSDDEIGTLLIERAARSAAAVGGATGAWAALPSLPAFAAEGNAADRARAYIGAWATRRGVYQVEGGLLLVAGSPLARQLTRRLAGRVRRSTLSLAPLFTGAVAGAVFNRRYTRRLGLEMRDDLRRHRQTFTATVVG